MQSTKPGASSEVSEDRTARMTRVQTVQAGKLLEEWYNKEKMSYLAGWSDERIANEVKCPMRSVADLRVDMFGRQKGGQAPGAYFGRMNNRVKDLEDRVERLEIFMRDATPIINTLK